MEKVEWLKNEINLWKEKFIIDEGTAEKILSLYNEENEEEIFNEFLVNEKNLKSERLAKKKVTAPVILSIIAAVLISCGIISLIAYNWAAISRHSKTIAAFIISFLPAVFVLLGIVNKDSGHFYNKRIIKEFASTLWALLFGASIQFLSQIYLLPIAWNIFFLIWLISSAVIMILSRSYGSFFLTAALLISYAVSEKTVLVILPVAVILLFYSLKNISKKNGWNLFMLILVLVSLFVVTVLLGFDNFWVAENSVYAKIVFYLLTAVSIAYPVINGIKEKKYSHRMIILIFPFVAAIFYTAYNFCGIEKNLINGRIIIFIISMIFVFYSALFLDKKSLCIALPLAFNLLLCSGWYYYSLAVAVFVFAALVIGLWRKCFYKENFINPFLIIANSIVALAYFLMMFWNENSIVAGTIKSESIIFQNIILAVILLMSFVMLALIINSACKNKICVIEKKFIETLIPFSFFIVFLILAYCNVFSKDAGMLTGRMLNLIFGIYATYKIINKKDFYLTGFALAFLLTFGIESIETASENIALILIFIFFNMALYIQSHKYLPAEITGKSIFAVTLFISVFPVFKFCNVYEFVKSADSKFEPAVCAAVFNIFIAYLFIVCILNFIKISIKEKRWDGIAEVVLSVFMLILCLLVQTVKSSKFLFFLESIVPGINLALLFIFAVSQIIYWITKFSVVGINLFSAYILIVAFIKFFTETRSLIARGIAFIVCGIIMLILNILITKYLKKGKKNEEA